MDTDLFDHFRHLDLLVSDSRRVGKDRFLAEIGSAGLIFANHVKNWRRVSRGFDALNIDGVELLNILKNVIHLPLVFLSFGVSEFDAGEVGYFADVHEND